MKVPYEGFKGGDRTKIELPDIQTQLMQELKAAGKKVIFVNCSGSAVAMVPETECCDAILQAWYPGEQGGTAVADVLFGDYNPAGRLPVTFYRSTEQLPDFEDYSMAHRTYRYFTGDVLFPFGYGLSYTTFSYGKARLSAKKKVLGDKVTLTLPDTNRGSRDGDEVVQLYVHRMGDAGAPIKTLRAFRRIHLKAGAKQAVSFELTPEAFAFFDNGSNTVRETAGEYEIFTGGNSRDVQKCKITIQ